MDLIAVIEDDPDIRTILELALKSGGYPCVRSAGRGDDGFDLVAREHPALVILDLMLPGMDGMDVCRRIRATAGIEATPIIMLTARTSESDIVRGLEAGADDYVTKPFSKKVLLARVHAVLRRPANCPSRHSVLDGLDLDEEGREVKWNGARIDLTQTEFNILRLLMSHPGRVYTRSQILDFTQTELKDVTPRTVDVQIVSLRKKLGAWSSHLETIRGIGYKVTP